MLYRVQYRQGLAHRYVRAESAHDARIVARDTWGMTKVIACKSNFVLTPNYGAAEYDRIANTFDAKRIDTKLAAASAVHAKAMRDDTLRKLYNPRRARQIARQNIVIEI